MSDSSYHSSRRSLLAATTTTAASLLKADLAWATEGPQSCTPTWASVDQHPPAAEWFQDAKFGIYYHWGVFSVSAFANEWYPRNMYNDGSGENNHHRGVYGDPSAWPYRQGPGRKGSRYA
jgi:alpha-L-fucosidase